MAWPLFTRRWNSTTWLRLRRAVRRRPRCGSLRMTAAFPPTAATPPGRWSRWRWKRWASRPKSRSISISGCRCRAGWERARPTRWRRWWGWKRNWAAAPSSGRNALTAGCERLEIAAQVGSDVPLFLIGGTVLGLDRGQEVYPLPDIEPVWCVVATPAMGVSTPQAFRDWDALCAAEGLTAEASADKLNELSRAYASAFAGAIPEGGREQAPPVSSPDGERTWPDPKSPRLSAPGSVAGSRTTLNASSFPSILPLQKSSAFLRPRHSGGSPPCLAVRVRFGALRVVPDPRRCGSGPRTVAAGGSAKLLDPHPAAHGLLARNASARSEIDSQSVQRERLAGGCEADSGVSEIHKLGDRLMVGQCPLEALVQVRILVAQPEFSSTMNPEEAAKANQLGGTRRWKREH